MSSTAGNRILRRLAGRVQDQDTIAKLLKFAAGNTIFLAGDGGGLRLQPASAVFRAQVAPWSAEAQTSVLPPPLPGSKNSVGATGCGSLGGFEIH